MSDALAHWRASDQTAQDLDVHLVNVGSLSGEFASKIQLGPAGELMGLLHDLGKYSREFQAYIKSAEGLINPDEDDYVDAKERKSAREKLTIPLLEPSTFGINFLREVELGH